MVLTVITYAGQHEQLQIDEEEIITFPQGLVGCGEWRRFVLLSDDETTGLHILHCLDDPAVDLLVTDPALVDPAYRVVIGADQRRLLRLERLEEALLLCILTSRGNPRRVTANLLGPLVVNPAARLGLQLVVDDSAYTTRHPLPAMPLSEGEGPHVSA